MKISSENRVLALAGIYQAAALVDTLSKKGYVDEIPLIATLNSLFIFAPNSVEEVYGGHEHYRKNLKLGINSLKAMLGKTRDGTISGNTIIYAMSLIHLQGRIGNNNKIRSELTEGMKQLQPRIQESGITDDNVLADLADLYVNTFGQFSFRIQVKGERRFLQNEAITNQVRACLLAGIRAVNLWRTQGGHSWHLMFFRKKMLKTLEAIS